MDGTVAPETKRTPLYSNAYALVANQVSSAGLGFLYWLLAARLYPVEVVGASSAAISTLLLIAALAQFGLKGGMARFIPRAGTRVRTLILSAYGLVAVTAGATTVVALWATGNLGVRALLAVGAPAPLLVVLATVAWALFYLQDGVLIGLRKSVWVLAENLAFNVAKIALLVLGAKMLGESGIVGSWFLPAPVAVALVTVAVFAHLRHVSAAGHEEDSRLTLREVASSVTADHAGAIAAEASVRLLPVIVVSLMGTAANAYFYQAWLVANTLTLVASGMTSSFAAEAAAEPDRIAEHGRGILRHMATMIVPAAAVLALAAPQVLALFGTGYAAAGAPVLRWLAVAALPVMFNVWYVSYTLVSGRPRRALGVQCLGAALLVGLAYPFLRTFGVTGVAIAWLVSQSLVAAFAALDAVPALTGARPRDTTAPAAGSLRRVDWRFLLDAPALGKTALFAEGGLAASVRSLAAEVVEGERASGAACDVAVAGDGRHGTLSSAYRSLRPGGACYAESAGRLPFASRRLAGRLRRAGFEDVRAYWPLPAIDRARVWPALRSPRPGYARAVRATMADAVPRVLAAAVGAATASGITASSVCAVGRKPGGGDADASWLPDRLGRLISDGAGAPEGETLLVMRTGGERDENRVNWLAFGRGADRPWAIAKASRASDASLRRERAMLDLLAARAALTRGLRVPRTVLWSEEPAATVLVQTMLPGVPALDHARESGFEPFASRITDALLGLADTPRRLPSASWAPLLVEPILAELEGLLADTEEHGLASEVRAELSRLGVLPLVLAHNDCSPWNTVVAEDGVGLFDWECASEPGLPMTDLVYCLATTALWLDGDPDPRDVGEAYERLLDPTDIVGAVFTRESARYADALGLDAEQTHLLRLATWLLHATNDLRNLSRAGAPLERSICLPLLRAEVARPATAAEVVWPSPEASLEEAVFISPHLDDAALSCGGGISRLVRAGTLVLVATVFTADARQGRPLSPQARRNHMRWGSDEPFAMRRAEDEAAMRALGADWTHLGLPEVIYRTDADGRPLSTHTPLHPDDVRETLPVLRERLERLLSSHPGARVFCPTGFGRQADHALVRLAVEQTCEPGRIVYYDEYPYTTRKDPARPADLPSHEFTLALTAEESASFVAAAACYRSQVRGLFPTPWERAAEVLASRVPALGRILLPQPTPSQALRRVASRFARDAEVLGGERYRRHDAGPSPFEAEGLRTA